MKQEKQGEAFELRNVETQSWSLSFPMGQMEQDLSNWPAPFKPMTDNRQLLEASELFLDHHLGPSCELWTLWQQREWILV